MTASDQVPEPTRKMSWHIGRLIIAWSYALMAAIAVVLWAPESQRYEWLAVAIGSTMLVSFALQLGTAQRHGFISRLSYSVVGGAFLVGLVEGVAMLVTGR